MQYALNYSGTRFLYTENQNYSMSWWIPSYQTLHNFYKSPSPEGVRLINHSFFAYSPVRAISGGTRASMQPGT